MGPRLLPDPDQRFIYMATAMNRGSGSSIGKRSRRSPRFGEGGRQPGQFYGVHSIATDSKGNIFTTETWEGKRIQKFVYKGIGHINPAITESPWPQL